MFNKFSWRAVLAGVVSIIFILIATALVPEGTYRLDYSIIYGTLAACVVMFGAEFGIAAYEKRVPSIAELGGAGLFGSIVGGAFMLLIFYIFGYMV